MYARKTESRIREALADTPVVLLAGPRQVGKSTLAEALPGRSYLTLDNDFVLQPARQDPAAWLSTLSRPITLDEVQRAPELFLPLKAAVDRRRTPGDYLLTGSANVLAIPKIADSLAGRMEVVPMLPLMQSEIEGSDGNFIDHIFAGGEVIPREWNLGRPVTERAMMGGFPEPLGRSSARRRQQWAQAYASMLMDRDLRDLAQLDTRSHLPQLIGVIAARNGSMLNLSEMSRRVGVPHTTLTRHYELLKRLYLVQEVPAWSANVATRFMRSPKVFMVDPLLAAAFGALGRGQAIEDRNPMGALLEGFVANELGRLLTVAETSVTLMHLRTVKDREVDFVLESTDGRIVGIEVKSAQTLAAQDFKGLRYLQEVAGRRFHRGIVLYDGERSESFLPGICALPFAAMWGKNSPITGE